jgi:hypothetical protein
MFLSLKTMLPNGRRKKMSGTEFSRYDTADYLKNDDDIPFR